MVTKLVLRAARLRALNLALALATVVGLGAAAPQKAEAGARVSFLDSVAPGTIVISAHQRRLYLVNGDGTAMSYPIAVPKRGKEWSGSTYVASMHAHPDWSPPEAVRRDHPNLPDVIPGGSPHNPMGARAIVLERNEVAIHGTTNKMRASIGSAASYGCIRMRNEDVSDLYNRVSVGTPVIMEP
ncbi:L,D-transpeptidase [Methylocystis bryophila]|uniref:L,D-transpeptidase n=1 Tax=Methylocystis bryophila TaxID=655015 RepID=A0A1W6N275_9HYPH|nr:L,D-transpeptidase [Methylocystis bryophila]ARN83871.1 L,D-transpeptidase [Methylocystis bryophila]